MLNRLVSVLMLLAILVSFSSSAQATATDLPDPIALVYVHRGSTNDLTRFASIGLPQLSLTVATRR